MILKKISSACSCRLVLTGCVRRLSGKNTSDRRLPINHHSLLHKINKYTHSGRDSIYPFLIPSLHSKGKRSKSLTQKVDPMPDPMDPRWLIEWVMQWFALPSFSVEELRRHSSETFRPESYTPISGRLQIATNQCIILSVQTAVRHVQSFLILTPPVSYTHLTLPTICSV